MLTLFRPGIIQTLRKKQEVCRQTEGAPSSTSVLSLHTLNTGRENIFKWLINLILHTRYLVKTNDFQEIFKTKNDNAFISSLLKKTARANVWKSSDNGFWESVLAYRGFQGAN